MLRNIALFLSALLLALTAGRSFWVWFGENPFNMSAAALPEGYQRLVVLAIEFQDLIPRIAMELEPVGHAHSLQVDLGLEESALPLVPTHHQLLA